MVETPADLRYKAMGGEFVRFHATSPLSRKMIVDLRALPFVVGELSFLDDRSVELIVEDASTAITRLLDWAEEEGFEIEAIGQQVPPFDDVFVKIKGHDKSVQQKVVTSEQGKRISDQGVRLRSQGGSAHCSPVADGGDFDPESVFDPVDLWRRLYQPRTDA